MFPLVLYFFGSFPTYFFIANLLVVLPYISRYLCYHPLGCRFALLAPPIATTLRLEKLFRWVLKTLIETVLRVVQLTETLPFAQVTNQHLSLAQLFFLLLFLYLFARYLVSRCSRSLLIALTSLLLFFAIGNHERLTGESPRLVVFNAPSTSEIAVFSEKRRHYIEIPQNGLLPHPTKGILRLSDGGVEQFHAEEPFPTRANPFEYRYFNVDRPLTCSCRR